MTERELSIPVAQPESLEAQVAKLTRWLEGWTDAGGKHNPGLLVLVGELTTELQARRERREAIARTLASGGLLAILSAYLAWMFGRVH